MQTTALTHYIPQSVTRIDPNLRRSKPAFRADDERRDEDDRVSGAHVCLIGAPDAYKADYMDICQIPTPEPGYNEKGNITYQPIGYAEFTDYLRDLISNELNLETHSEEYALAANGQELYGMMCWKLPENDSMGLALALRSSLNQQIAPAWGIGGKAFVCANGSFSVDGMVKSARQTTNVRETLLELGSDIASTAIDDFRTLAEEMQAWQDCPMNDFLFGAYLGILQMLNDGKGVIGSRQANLARRYWMDCKNGDLHSEHAEANLWSAYHAVTATQQRVSPRNQFRGYGNLHNVTRAICDSGGVTSDRLVIPEIDVESLMRVHA